ncbi:MAG TPA: quinolinate synthase NadA [Dehalococcoidia bacterium]|nr:quinolinate synthase NadA [Dehalococcoidia bacterium]
MTTRLLGTSEEALEVLPLAGIACETNTGTRTLPLSQEPSFAYWQQDIPREYWDLTSEVLVERVAAARKKLGEKLIVLGHHYQREDIIQFADFRGDSFKLAQWAAGHPEADYIVFCGVHFMAEAADILSAPHQTVVLPNMAAGCSMADMADPEDVYACWEELEEAGIADKVVPVTYMNSAASLKAFCGRHGGIVCTSSNATAVLQWAFERGEKVLFFPDQHLGRNTGVKMGVPLDQMPLWNYNKPYGSLGGMPREVLERSRIILWQGHCSVHQRFTVSQIEAARARFPNVHVVVHPECRLEVVQAADSNGSTEFIARTVREGAPGSVFAVGTEINLVSRLAHENPDKTVFCLDPVVCPCSTMYRIHPAYLAWTVEELATGRVVNQVKVDEETAHYAKIALDRMLAVT